MYCPNCRSGYRPGFTRWNDCDVALVADLPVEVKPEFVDVVEVLSTADAGQMSIIKSILEAEDIPYPAQGENFALARTKPLDF